MSNTATKPDRKLDIKALHAAYDDLAKRCARAAKSDPPSPELPRLKDEKRTAWQAWQDAIQITDAGVDIGPAKTDRQHALDHAVLTHAGNRTPPHLSPDGAVIEVDRDTMHQQVQRRRLAVQAAQQAVSDAVDKHNATEDPHGREPEKRIAVRMWPNWRMIVNAWGSGDSDLKHLTRQCCGSAFVSQRRSASL